MQFPCSLNITIKQFHNRYVPVHRIAQCSPTRNDKTKVPCSPKYLQNIARKPYRIPIDTIFYQSVLFCFNDYKHVYKKYIDI